MNILTAMATNSSVRRVFGNHNMTRLYLDYIRNPDSVLLPPFRPVLYRAIACGGPNDIETILINDKSLHQAKNRQVLHQLVDQYIVYQQTQTTE